MENKTRRHFEGTPRTTAEPWSDEQGTKLVKIFKAVAHPVRLSILRMLADGNARTVTEIYTRLRADQSAVSHHLGMMRRCGLLDFSRQGKYIHYYITNDAYIHLIQQMVSLQRADSTKGVAESQAAVPAT